jgi:hypothetical protein
LWRTGNALAIASARHISLGHRSLGAPAALSTLHNAHFLAGLGPVLTIVSIVIQIVEVR